MPLPRQLLSLAPGQASKSITVHVTSGGAHEDDEVFEVELSNPAAARASARGRR